MSVDPATLGILRHLRELKLLPARVIDAAVVFSESAVPHFPCDLVRQSCLDWRGDLGRYLMEQLEADEVLLDVPTERSRLILPSGGPAPVRDHSLPFFFKSQLALLPTELELISPQFAEFIVDIEKEKGREFARAHLERAMAVTAWILLRLSIDENLHKSRALIAEVSDTGVDLIWKERPILRIFQDLKTMGLSVVATTHGELVPKRKVTVELSQSRH